MKIAEIAEQLPGRSEFVCSSRCSSLGLPPKRAKIKWTKEQEDKLLELKGDKLCWKRIVKELPGEEHTPQVCSKRYHILTKPKSNE
jgi:hypothetical protein